MEVTAVAVGTLNNLEAAMAATRVVEVEVTEVRDYRLPPTSLVDIITSAELPQVLARARPASLYFLSPSIPLLSFSYITNVKSILIFPFLPLHSRSADMDVSIPSVSAVSRALDLQPIDFMT